MMKRIILCQEAVYLYKRSHVPIASRQRSYFSKNGNNDKKQ